MKVIKSPAKTNTKTKLETKVTKTKVVIARTVKTKSEKDAKIPVKNRKVVQKPQAIIIPEKTATPENRSYSVEVNVIRPLLRNLPDGYRVNGYRNITAGKELIKYQITAISTQQLAAEAEVKRMSGKMYLDNLHVEPSHRNLGLASYLIDLVLLNHQSQDVYLVPEQTHDKNVSRSTLERFFTKFGFAVIDGKRTMMRRATAVVDFANGDAIVM